MGIAERNNIVPCWRKYPTERENIEILKDIDYKKDTTSFYIRYSLWSWLENAQSIKTPCNELGDVGLLEQPWPQLIYYTSYKLCGHNFRK